MQEHMQTMQESMKTMRGMGGPMMMDVLAMVRGLTRLKGIRDPAPLPLPALGRKSGQFMCYTTGQV